MADIKTITLPSGTTYNLVDQGARDLIAGLSSSTKYLGVTTTQLVDGVTTSPNITVAGETVTATSGDIATYGNKEFIYSGTVWQEFGDLSSLGTLAYKDSASGNFTPNGSVSQPTFSGNSMTSTGKFTPNGSVGLTNTAKTPALTKSTGTSSDYTVKEVSSVSVGTTSTTPTVTIAEGSGTDYQVTGTVGTPTITVTPNTTTVNSITDVGSLPAFTATVQNENLTLTWDEGTLPTKGSNTTVATGIQSATSTQPTFTGGRIKATASAVTTPTGSATVTPSYVKLENGSIDVPTSATFTGTEGNVNVSGTPSGTVSKPNFTGTSGTVTVS